MEVRNEIQEFIFPITNQAVRVTDQNGDPWFVAKDVCEILGVANVSDALSRLDGDEKSTIVLNDGAMGGPPRTIISEAGLYSLVLSSRKPEAKSFKRWVTHEVLPAIRKTGGYSVSGNRIADMLDDPKQTNALLLELMVRREKDQETIKVQAEQLAQAAPKVAALERLEAAEGSMCPTDAAKTLGVRPKKLFDFLKVKRWAYKRPGNASWLAYQEKIQAGYLDHRHHEQTKPDGTLVVRTQMVITAKGLARLSEELNGTLFN